MEKLKTICSDVYVMETSKEMRELMNRHSKKFFEVAKDFVKNNVDIVQHLEFLSRLQWEN